MTTTAASCQWAAPANPPGEPVNKSTTADPAAGVGHGGVAVGWVGFGAGRAPSRASRSGFTGSQAPAARGCLRAGLGPRAAGRPVAPTDHDGYADRPQPGRYPAAWWLSGG